MTRNVSGVNEDYTVDIASNVDAAPQNVDIYKKQDTLLQCNNINIIPRSLDDSSKRRMNHLLLIDQLLFSESVTDIEYTANILELLLTIFAPKTCRRK